MEQPTTTTETQSAGAKRQRVRAELNRLFAALEQNYKGFSTRDSQREMAEQTAEVLAGLTGTNLLACEAPTGTGKSLAYLVGALAAHTVSPMRIVISTGTVLLQEQLVKRDIPAFLKATGMEHMTVAIAKGVGRYACLQKAEAALAERGNRAFDFGDEHGGGAWPRAPRTGEIDLISERVALARRGKWDCDLDGESAIRQDLHGMLAASSSTCVGTHCPDAQRCGMLRAKSVVRDANIIVCNHSLVLSCLAYSDAPWFSRLGDAVWIFDEGHLLPDVARDAFTGHLRPKGALEAIKALASLTQAMKLVLNGNAADEIKHALASLDARLKRGTIETALADLNAMLEQAIGEEEQCRFPVGPPPEPLYTAVSNFAGEIGQTLDAAAKINEAPSNIKAGASSLFIDWGKYLHRIEIAARACSMASRQDESSVCWITKPALRAEPTLHVAPIEAGPILAGYLWAGGTRAVLTSATLRAMGEFKKLQRDCGLPPTCRTAALPSPFDLSRSTIATLRSHTNPNSSEHQRNIARAAKHLIEVAPPGTGMLLIATSWAMLRTIVAELDGNCGAGIRAQGDGAKSTLIQEHKRAVAAGEKSILIGLDSFAEGLDLPGNACRILVIGKLPFAQPDGPIEAARTELAERRGINPFAAITLPEASRKLTQICGRLVRTVSDDGLICLMDPRLTSRTYGRAMLRSLTETGYRAGEFTTPSSLSRLLNGVVNRLDGEGVMEGVERAQG